MRLLSWNIQWGRGCDGVVDLARITRVIRQTGDFDVICLQEVAVNHPGLPGSSGEDEIALLRGHFPGYSIHYGIGSDLAAPDGSRRLFGNAVLSRLPVQQVLRHSLPCPSERGKPGMPRMALEVIVDDGNQTLRVTTTHLEYYSVLQRAAQINHLRTIHEEAYAHALNATINRDLDAPFGVPPRPAASVYCGDFNCEPDATELKPLLAPFGTATPALLDAWCLVHPDTPHAYSVGLHGCEWPDRAYCCDYFFVSDNLRDKVRQTGVNQETDASDHQPIFLELDL